MSQPAADAAVAAAAAAPASLSTEPAPEAAPSVLEQALGGAALQVLHRTPLPAAAPLVASRTPAAAAAPDDPSRPAAEMLSRAEVAALLAKKRGAPLSRLSLAAASPSPRAADAQLQATPARPTAGAAASALAASPLPESTPSAASSERRPAMKRPAVRPTPAGGDAKRSRLGAPAEDTRAARQWAKVLGGQADGEAEPGSSLHLRRVYITELKASADVSDLKNVRSHCRLGGDVGTWSQRAQPYSHARAFSAAAQSMLRWGVMDDAHVDQIARTGMVTFKEAASAKKVIGACSAHFARPVAHVQRRRVQQFHRGHRRSGERGGGARQGGELD